jgi:integrase/recombinase XerD
MVAGQPVNTHTIHHRFATHLLDGGAGSLSISRLLGRVNLKTIEIYTHVNTRHLRGAYQWSHRRAYEA